MNSAACGSVQNEPRSKRYGIMDRLISPRYSYKFCKYEQRLYGRVVWSDKLQCVLISTVSLNPGSRGSRYPVSLSYGCVRHETHCETERQTRSPYAVNEGESHVNSTFLNSLVSFFTLGTSHVTEIIDQSVKYYRVNCINTS